LDSGSLDSGSLGRDAAGIRTAAWQGSGRSGESTGSPLPHANPEPVIRTDLARDLPGPAEPARRDDGEGARQLSPPDTPKLAGLSTLGPPAQPSLGATVPSGSGSAGS